jgi:GGDEF domain-containing protein
LRIRQAGLAPPPPADPDGGAGDVPLGFVWVDDPTDGCLQRLMPLDALRMFEGCRLGASVGIAVRPADGEDAHQLLSAADTSMYVRKARKRDGPARTRWRAPPEGRRRS